MNAEGFHFRGESFGAGESAESETDDYLKNLISHYKSCFILERSGKSPEDLVQIVRSIEREVNLLDCWNKKLEEMSEMKDLEIERLNEDLEAADEELGFVERQRKMLEDRIEYLYKQKALKDAIIQRQENLMPRKEKNLTPKKIVPKTSRIRYESPTLV